MKHPTYNSVNEGMITAFDFNTADSFESQATWRYYVPGITEYPKSSFFLRRGYRGN